jgi:hypothetical protein
LKPKNRIETTETRISLSSIAVFNGIPKSQEFGEDSKTPQMPRKAHMTRRDRSVKQFIS